MTSVPSASVYRSLVLLLKPKNGSSQSVSERGEAAERTGSSGSSVGRMERGNSSPYRGSTSTSSKAKETPPKPDWPAASVSVSAERRWRGLRF